jgi:hypothetical protein
MTPTQVLTIVTKVTQWAQSHPDIRGAALVGSWARKAARPDSDLDVLLLATDPTIFRAEIPWPEAFRLAEAEWWHDVDYGPVWSRHVQTGPELTVEYSFAPLSWADTAPVEAGTAQVIRHGCQILHDPDGRLARLIEAVSP